LFVTGAPNIRSVMDYFKTKSNGKSKCYNQRKMSIFSIGNAYINLIEKRTIIY
jgi:hypothetical protein